ncbi:hypothetical protein T261_5794 [Streptomyces lydicus]|nr:hypothetical protein T261_5794 [Streptomyces lydicus]
MATGHETERMADRRLRLGVIVQPGAPGAGGPVRSPAAGASGARDAVPAARPCGPGAAAAR